MALITCPDCQSQVSDLSPACPKCGRPIRPQTIEATGKSWKATQFVGILVFFAGFFVWALALAVPDLRRVGPPAGIAAVLGFAAYIIGRIGGWWYHG